MTVYGIASKTLIVNRAKRPRCLRNFILAGKLIFLKSLLFFLIFRLILWRFHLVFVLVDEENMVSFIDRRKLLFSANSLEHLTRLLLSLLIWSVSPPLVQIQHGSPSFKINSIAYRWLHIKALKVLFFSLRLQQEDTWRVSGLLLLGKPSSAVLYMNALLLVLFIVVLIFVDYWCWIVVFESLFFQYLHDVRSKSVTATVPVHIIFGHKPRTV